MKVMIAFGISLIAFACVVSLDAPGVPTPYFAERIGLDGMKRFYPTTAESIRTGEAFRTRSFLPQTWAGGFSGGGAGGTDRYTLNVLSGASTNPLASSTYEYGPGDGASFPTTGPRYPLVVPIASTLVQHYWIIFINGTAASAGNVTHQARKWTAASSWTTSSDTAGVAFSWTGVVAYTIGGGETGLSVSYAAGDAAQPIFVTPAWVTAPIATRLATTFLFTVP